MVKEKKKSVMSDFKDYLNLKAIAEKLFGNEQENDIDFEGKNPGIECWNELQNSYERTKKMEKEIYSPTKVINKLIEDNKFIEGKIRRKKLENINKQEKKNNDSIEIER